MFKKNELLNNEILKNGVERKYIKLYFGSRCEEDFEDVILNDRIFDIWYNDFKIGTANKGVPIKIIFLGINQTTIRVDFILDSFFIIIDFFNFDK